MQYEEGAVELSKYRLETAESTYRMAELCYENGGYRDAVKQYLNKQEEIQSILKVQGAQHEDT